MSTDGNKDLRDEEFEVIKDGHGAQAWCEEHDGSAPAVVKVAGYFFCEGCLDKFRRALRGE